MKEKILEALKNTETKFISGEKLSEKLGVSRTTVWKYIKELRKEGYQIESYSKKGYRLNESANMLSKVEIAPYLNTKYIGKEYKYLDEIDTTNEEVKRIQSEYEEGLVVVAEKQTRGKGRLGRSWKSPEKKGIYMSILLKPDIIPQDATKMTQIAAASVVEALNELGISGKVKWPNDIVLDSKKICGILTEMTGELLSVEYIVVGIGINTSFTNQDISDDIKGKASSINIELESEVNRKKLLAFVLNNFELLYEDFIKTGNIDKSLRICKENSAVLGKEIKIITKNSEEIKKAIDIDSDGALVVEDDYGNIEKLISGEISIRGVDSYI